jgi:DNA-binding beta-propeller fold protein YncE
MAEPDAGQAGQLRITGGEPLKCTNFVKIDDFPRGVIVCRPVEAGAQEGLSPRRQPASRSRATGGPAFHLLATAQAILRKQAMKKQARIISILGLLSSVAFGPGQADAAVNFRLQSVVALKGTAPRWDYLTFDSARSYLFLGRRKEGVTVLNTLDNQVVGKVENSEGANIAALVPEFNRGYTANVDGTTTVFDLATFKAIARTKLGKGADSAFYEPKTKQVVFTLGGTKELVFVDAKTAAITARLPMNSDELEGVAMDGDGALFVNERDTNKIAKVDARTHRLVAEWKIAGCVTPTGLAMDGVRQRLFIGCRGAHPVLAVLDAAAGKVVATLEIGRGNDGVFYDPTTRRVFTANGIDGNLVIFDQVTADRYKLAGALTTRPFAKTLAMDPATQRIFTMTAEGMVDPAKPVNLEVGPFYPNQYFDDTLTVLVYAPHT